MVNKKNTNSNSNKAVKERVNTRIIQEQQEWAFAQGDNAYRVPKMDFDLWESIASNQYEAAQKMCNNSVNSDHGKNWKGIHNTWEDFIADDKYVWPISKLTKDLNSNKTPQRPFDPNHLVKNLIEFHNGEFDHALAGTVDVAMRPDGSNNVWDHYHTILYATLCGITHVRVNVTYHPKSLTYTQCREQEILWYYAKNGRNKQSGAEEIFVKENIIAESNGDKLEDSPKRIIGKMFHKAGIDIDGSNCFDTKVSGIGCFVNGRTMLHKMSKDDKKADEEMQEYISILRNRFGSSATKKKVSISGYMFLGLIHFVTSFNHIESLNPSSIKNMFDFYTDKDMDDYISTNKNLKNNNAESISLRFSKFWSDYMFKSTTTYNKRRPIRAKDAVKVYGLQGQKGNSQGLPDEYINAAFDTKISKKVDVQCDHCDKWSTKNVDDLESSEES